MYKYTSVFVICACLKNIFRYIAWQVSSIWIKSTHCFLCVVRFFGGDVFEWFLWRNYFSLRGPPRHAFPLRLEFLWRYWKYINRNQYNFFNCSFNNNCMVSKKRNITNWPFFGELLGVVPHLNANRLRMTKKLAI